MFWVTRSVIVNYTCMYIVIDLYTEAHEWLLEPHNGLKIFSFFGERPLTLSPKFSQKWIIRCKNTLRRWDKDHIVAYNMYFHVDYIGNLHDFSFFSERPFIWFPEVSPKWITRSRNMLRRWGRNIIQLKDSTFPWDTMGNPIRFLAFSENGPVNVSPKS